jgi:2'-5' RNA ligase
MEPSESLEQNLRALQSRLKALPAGRAVRYVAPENIHLTFKFLGNVEKGAVPSVMRALERAAHGLDQMELTAQGLGCFPNPKRPNNVWVGLEGGVDTAALLAQRIEDDCESEGVPRSQRGFAPHLTVGRVKRDASNDDRRAIGRWVGESPVETFGALKADEILLISSEFRPRGPVYSVLARVPL